MNEQEPVALMDSDGFAWTKQGVECRTTPDTYMPLYTTPPQRKPLTDEEIYLAINQIDRGEQGWSIRFARAIEAAHGIKL